MIYPLWPIIIQTIVQLVHGNDLQAELEAGQEAYQATEASRGVYQGVGQEEGHGVYLGVYHEADLQAGLKADLGVDPEEGLVADHGVNQEIDHEGDTEKDLEGIGKGLIRIIRRAPQVFQVNSSVRHARLKVKLNPQQKNRPHNPLK